MTNSERMRDSAVVMSSTMPSAKYSCSGSPLIFSNGSTTSDGLSGNGRAGRSAASKRTRNTRIFVAMFFSAGSPRSSTSSAILPEASSRTRDEMQMPPGSASGSNRAAMITPSPIRSSPSGTTSPWCTPMRSRRLSARARNVPWMAMAQRSACTVLANSTKNPSPVVLNNRPPCVPASGSIVSVRNVRTRASVPGSSAPTMAE
jgi:hypothetical protein